MQLVTKRLTIGLNCRNTGLPGNTERISNDELITKTAGNQRTDAQVTCAREHGTDIEPALARALPLLSHKRLPRTS